ncbi:hypothetical protein ACFX1S_045649 [Malus domestica]
MDWLFMHSLFAWLADKNGPGARGHSKLGLQAMKKTCRFLRLLKAMKKTLRFPTPSQSNEENMEISPEAN